MLARLILFSLVAVFALEAQATIVTVLGRQINVVIPTGYCEVGKHPADVELVRSTRDGIGNSNQILAMFADCRELDEFRKGNFPA
ncbi:hypothetical protein SCT_3208 [Sulfuricella sp. T08]|uniref:hypothetical protein n=1 Tax=Sulfuricella sp. T08 TaxID=1632857 RepID=UPI000617A190|nr:hypothetical protein [Sulfuricella sp. T08]GAO37771.1 hypothetical protein SCT_3208 [Sulfuricella sp. T08]